MGSNSNPIGVIDSGVGGLSMVIALDQLLSSEEIVYVADPLHFPYGEKAKNELIHIVSSLVSYLNENLKVKLIITACGTISSNCLEELSALFQVVKSSTFQKHLQRIHSSITVKEEAWPEFVEAVEKGLHQTDDWRKWIHTQLIGFQQENFDTIIMGCTHFALISSFFQDIAETTFEIINPAIATAQEVKEYLEKSNLLNPSELSKKRIIVRGNSTNIKKTIQKYTDLQKINIEAFPEKIIENFINKAQRYCTPASTPM